MAENKLMKQWQAPDGTVYDICDETAREMASGGGGGYTFTLDDTLRLQDGVLGVNTANAPEQDNTLPITSAAVAATVGNIEAILKTI